MSTLRLRHIPLPREVGFRWVTDESHAEAVCADGVRIAAYPNGGGINTYDSLSLRVMWPDKTMAHLGVCSAEELRLPNYVPLSQRNK